VFIYSFSFHFYMSNTTKALSLALVVIIMILGYQVVMKKDDASVVAVIPTNTQETGAPIAATPELTTKSLSTVATYTDPSGEVKVGFTVVIDQNGTIVDATTEVLGTNDITKIRQNAFAEEFPTAVKGKKLSELTAIDRVGGSSLTTKAFNDSLTVLKAQI
jgi:predicted NUDIX family NTP pyrophosphohydrolase